MLRRTTYVFLLALAIALPLAVVGTANDPASAGKARRATLLFASFDSLATGQMTGTKFQSQFGGVQYANWIFDDSTVASAEKSYRVRLEAGTINGNPSSGNHGIALAVPLARQVNNACIRYRIRFGENFDWSKGGKLPGLSGVAPGVSPTVPTGGGNPGDKGWSGRLMWGSGGSVSSYMYHPKQPSYYGQGFGWSRRVDDGRWHVLRQCYRMNTVGKKNGVLRAWLDGARVLNRTDFVYRLKNTVHISHLMWSVFRGGATMDWAGHRDSHVDFDRVRVTTRR